MDPDVPPSAPAGPEALDLHLRLNDPQVVGELLLLPEGAIREAHVQKALKIGLIALKHVRGEIDAESVRRQGERILEGLEGRLDAHRATLHDRLEEVLKQYFHPESGRFAERVKGLVARDGELAGLLRGAVGREDSELAKTLRAQVGPGSELMRLLSPTETEGLQQRLMRALEGQLEAQRERILDQFTLDRPESALARLVSEIERKHGELTGGLEQRIDGVVREFSLDEENSALKRLVDRVDAAQQRISKEFSLDESTSALARMRGEMIKVLAEYEERNARFRDAVLGHLHQMQGAREESERSTRHGLTFEQAVFERIQACAQEAGDIATFSGSTTGLIRNNKKGDVVVELGPDAAGAGERIVIEAKQVAGYGLAQAVAEIAEARKNRAAQIGVFVFSRRSAPEGIRTLQRLGQDVVLVWDAEDERSDVFLDAGLTLARALCTRGARDREAHAVDLGEMDRAILEVEKQAGGLADVGTWAATIQSSSEKILRKVETAQKAFGRQVDALRDLLQDLREA